MHSSFYGFQNMSVWGQMKSTGCSDRKREEASLLDTEIQAQQLIHIFVIKRLLLTSDTDKSSLFQTPRKLLCDFPTLWSTASKLALK